MAVLEQGESCSIPGGHEDVVVTNLSLDKGGSYDITGDGIAINKQIEAGTTQHTAIHKNPATVTNSGKPSLDVANCEKDD